MSARIRKAVLEDARRIANVGIKSWQASYRGIFPDEKLDSMSLKDSTENWVKILSDESKNPDLVMYVVENYDNEIIGFAGGGKYDADTPFDCEISRIYIQKMDQNKGIGTQLFNQLLDFFLSRNWKTMIVWTLENNAYRRFYDKMKGIPHEKSVYTKWEVQYNLVGYVWENISFVRIK